MTRLSHGNTKVAATYTAKINRAALAISGFDRVQQTTSKEQVSHSDISVGHLLKQHSTKHGKTEDLAARRGVEPLFPG